MHKCSRTKHENIFQETKKNVKKT